MSLGIMISEPEMAKFDDYVEQDMRRWWRHQCKVHRRKHEIFIEVAPPIKLNLYEGIKRLASFGVNARAARSRNVLFSQ